MISSAYVTFAVTYDRDRSAWFWVVVAGLPRRGVPRGKPLAHGWAQARAEAEQAARAVDPTGLFSIEQPPLGRAILKRKTYAADGKSQATRGAEAQAGRERDEAERARREEGQRAQDARDREQSAAERRAIEEGWSQKTAAELDEIVRAETRAGRDKSAVHELARALWRAAFAREWEEAARRVWNRQAGDPKSHAPPRRPGELMARDALLALGLSPSATAADIKQRYRQLALQHHPDRGGDAAAFIASTKAYERALRAVAADRPGATAPL